jgi:hypothetical protein
MFQIFAVCEVHSEVAATGVITSCASEWKPPIITKFRRCATGVTGKIVAASATVALSDIYHPFLIFQSYICNVINLFIQKENG